MAFGLCLMGAQDTAEGVVAVERVVAAVQCHYDGVKTLRARFKQSSFVASIGKRDLSEGSVIVERPGRMRWEYDKPDARIILLDKGAIRMYVPEDKQLQIASTDAGGISPTALAFLLGDRKLRETFAATRVHQEGTEEIGLKLVPRQDEGFEFLELWVDPKSHQVRRSIVVDLFSNRTELVLEQVQENAGVVEADFSIKVPEDTDVIDLR